MSIYEREWSAAEVIPTTLAEASDDASKTLITYLEAARKNAGTSQIVLKGCTITDDRVIAGVRSTTFTAIFRENQTENQAEVAEDAAKVGGSEESSKANDNINERAHLTIRLFVGPGSPRSSRSSMESTDQK